MVQRRHEPSPDQLELFPYWATFTWVHVADDEPFGRFVLLRCALDRAEQLLMTGDCTLADAVELVETLMREGFAGNASTTHNVLKEIGAFVRFAQHHDVTLLADVDATLVADFVFRAARVPSGYREPGYSTKRNRRWALQQFFDALTRLGLRERLHVLLPTVIGTPGDPTCPLTANELARVHDVAYHWGLEASRRPLVVAFAEAGGSALEIASVRLGDLDLELGTIRFRGRSARINPLPAHTLGVVRAALNDGAAVGERLVVGDLLDDDRAKRSVTQELNSVITAADVRARPGVSGRSIQLTAARTVLDTEGLEAAARFMGAESLDTTAASLGYHWRQY